MADEKELNLSLDDIEQARSLVSSNLGNLGRLTQIKDLPLMPCRYA
jgi:hypothetical protein